MKLFIPSDCKLFSIAINVADNNYNNWLQELHNLCHNTEEKVMTFLDTIHLERTGKHLSNSIKYKARFEATYKMLEDTPKNKFPSNQIPSDIIFTQESSLHPFYNSINQWMKVSRK